MLQIKTILRTATMLAQSDYQRSGKENVLEYIQKLYDDILLREDCLSLKKLAVRGQDLIAAGLNPGKELGDILHGDRTGNHRSSK